MNKLIKEFLSLAKNDEPLTLKDLMSEEETTSWEVMVKAMDSIDILHVGRDLEKVSKMFILNREQQLFLLAYVKLLEMMIGRAKDAGADKVIDSISTNSGPSMNDSYSGSMFG